MTLCRKSSAIYRSACPRILSSVDRSRYPIHRYAGCASEFKETQASKKASRQGAFAQLFSLTSTIRPRTSNRRGLRRGHTTAAMTLKHYVKGRREHADTAHPIAVVYGLATDANADWQKPESACGAGLLKVSTAPKPDQKADKASLGRYRGRKAASDFPISCKFHSKTKKELAFLQVLMELMTGFEPVTSSLPRIVGQGATGERSTD